MMDMDVPPRNTQKRDKIRSAWISLPVELWPNSLVP